MSGRSRKLANPNTSKNFFVDIGVGRAGFGRAQGPVDEIETFQTTNDVAADFLAGEARNFRIPPSWAAFSKSREV